MANKIEIQNVSKHFGGTQVLKGVDLVIPSGQTTVILGGSGSGKSVLLKCILGLVTPDQGKVLIDGKNTTGLKEVDRYKLMTRFGMLFQSGALFDSMNNWENVAFGLLERKMKRKQARDIGISKLRMVGLKPEVADKMPSEMSGGMRKRVALARAICLEPEIIFYDEPTTGLDPITSDVINDLILKLKEELHITSVVITHDMTTAFKVGDYVAMLYDGKIIARDTGAKMQKIDNPFVQQFIHGRAEGPILVGR